MKRFAIYYSKNPSFTFNPALTFDQVEKEETHTYLQTISVESLDEVFHAMQGEVWSPNGEARFLVRLRNLYHTSMSVGDVAIDLETVKAYQVSSIGWKELI